MRANPTPAIPPAPLPTRQLELPLILEEEPIPITPQEVWEKLDQPQRELIFRQLVRICCQLTQSAKPMGASDE